MVALRGTLPATVADAVSPTLAARLAAGDEGAIQEAYAVYGRSILGYLRRIIGPADAEDVLQTVFYEAWRSAQRFDPKRRLDAWLFGIARNRALDYLRRQRGSPAPLDELLERVGEDGRELADRYAEAERVQHALEVLPDEQRSVLELAYFGDLTQAEIASRLHVPLGTVKARMFRGLRRLATHIGAEP
jgi:RNA polymerase sigma factor (sigma-70 family)